VQTLLGHGSVVTAVVDGGRAPAERTRLVPWGDERGRDERGRDETPTAPAVDHARPPWPGHIPAPAPSVLIDPPRPVQVLDAAGQPVTITARGAVPTAPTRLALGSGAPVAITAWAGPWPVDDSWWNHARSRPRPVDAVSPVSPVDPGNPIDPVTGTNSPALRRRARFQLVDVHGRAYLVTCAVPLVLPAAVGDTTAVADADDCSPRWTLDALYD
jgi:protein ImuB